MNQQQWMRSNKSELGQRCQDFTWRRRLDTRRSAARRPFTFQFQTRVAIITKDFVIRSSRYAVYESSEVSRTRCWLEDENDYLMCKLFCDFFNSVICDLFKLEEDEKKGDDNIQTQPSASSTHAQCPRLVLMFRSYPMPFIKTELPKPSPKCWLTCR